MPLLPSLITVPLLACAPGGDVSTVRSVPSLCAYEGKGENASSPRPRWEGGGPYFTMGVAPLSTLTRGGFHPGIRYNAETGLAWSRGSAELWIGADFHMLQYHGKPRPGWGVDVVTTISGRHVYGQLGAGTAMGIPAGADVRDVRPAMGGLVGVGLVGRLDKVEGRLGVDYDFRVDTAGRISNTVFIAVRLAFGR